jgi:hypothetical protein
VRPAALVLLALGLALGPGYFLYAKYLTGAGVGTYPLDGAPGGGFAPVAMTLEPGMSPVRLVLRLSAEHGTGYPPAPRNGYRAVVTGSTGTVATSTFELVSSTFESSFQELGHVVATFEVPAAGEYRVGIEAAGEPQMRVTAAAVEVRRNVREPDLRVVWTGAALIGLAVFALLLR